MICSDLSSPFFKFIKRILPETFCYIGNFISIQKNRINECRYDSSGEGGIRTHAPLRTNGFQDRLVMTTSIPLHILFCRFLFMSFATSSILSYGLYYVNTFLNFFKLFFKGPLFPIFSSKNLAYFQVFRRCDFNIFIASLH